MFGLVDFQRTCIKIDNDKKWDIEFVIAFNVLIVCAYKKDSPSVKLKKSFSCAIQANDWVLENLK